MLKIQWININYNYERRKQNTKILSDIFLLFLLNYKSLNKSNLTFNFSDRIHVIINVYIKCVKKSKQISFVREHETDCLLLKQYGYHWSQIK